MVRGKMKTLESPMNTTFISTSEETEKNGHKLGSHHLKVACLPIPPYAQREENKAFGGRGKVKNRSGLTSVQPDGKNRRQKHGFRGLIRQFLSWCGRKDYLSPAHRLFEADAGRQFPSGLAVELTGLAGIWKSATASGCTGSKLPKSSVMNFASGSLSCLMPATTHFASS